MAASACRCRLSRHHRSIVHSCWCSSIPMSTDRPVDDAAASATGALTRRCLCLQPAALLALVEFVQDASPPSRSSSAGCMQVCRVSEAIQDVYRFTLWNTSAKQITVYHSARTYCTCVMLHFAFLEASP